MNITYQRVGDYNLPNLALPAQEPAIFGKYSSLHLEYIKAHHRVRYVNLLTSCKLQQYLNEIDRQASEQVERIIADFAQREGTDEGLKARDQMEWVRRMNGYKARAEEVVYLEVVYR